VKFGLMIHHGPEMAERNMWDMTRAFGLAGTPDRLIAGFRDLAAAGAQCCIVQMNGENDPDAVRLFGEEVIPALADA